MTQYEACIYTADLGDTVFVRAATDTEQGPLLELTADVGDEETTVRLDDFHVRELRLALTRYERLRKQGKL